MEKFQYQAQSFDRLYGTPGFSDALLKNHFTLYEGYVTNANKLIEKFDAMAKEGKLESPEFAETRRRFGWEWNGMRLHELYFGNMSKEKHPYQKDSWIVQKIENDFGSFEDWQKDFKGTGAMRGIGWAVLYYDTIQERLLNAWINEHDTGHFSGAVPLLIMDVFEHAFMMDYGVKRAGYIESFFNAVCWKTVEKRFEKACTIAEACDAHPKAA